MNQKSKIKFNLIKFISCIFITEGAGLIGSLATFSSVKTWYLELAKPFFNPPSWIFAPVWTFLFFLMGISLYLVWDKKNNLLWFWIQLLLNIAWSFIFFGFHSPMFAFYEIILLWFSIVIMMVKFWRYHQGAVFLLIPYLVWVSFASFLNFAIFSLN